MKIAILGTSNGVIHGGYGHILSQNTSSHQVHNFSLGSNCSLYAGYKIDKEEIVYKYDYCVLDFCINDQNFYDRECLTLRQSAANLFGALCKFNKSHCKPLVLILSNERHSHRICDSLIATNTAAITSMLNIKTINFAKIVNDFYADIPTSEIYKEPTHYLPTYQRLIADYIYYEISSDHGSYNINTLPGIHVGANIISELEYLKCTKSKRGTSLVQTETIVLNDESEVRMDAKLYLCGMLYWSDQHVSAISVSNKYESMHKNLYLGYSHSGLFMRNFYHQMPIDRLTIKLKKTGDDILRLDPTHDASVYIPNRKHPRVEIVGYCTSNVNLDILGEFVLNIVEVSCKYGHASWSMHSEECSLFTDEVVAFLKHISFLVKGDRGLLLALLGDMSIIFKILAKLTYLHVMFSEHCIMERGIFSLLQQTSDRLNTDKHYAENNFLQSVEMLQHFDEYLECKIKHLSTSHESREYLNQANFILRAEILRLLEQISLDTSPKFSVFDEGAYLQLNTDVATAVRDGRLHSGFVHWILYGIDERRMLSSNHPRDHE